MRKLFLASSIFCIFILSCKNKAQKLEGKWIVKDYTITNLEEAVKKQLMGTPDSLLTERKKMVEKNINMFLEESKKETFTFSRDSFDSFRGGRPDKGIWKLSSDGMVLFMISNDNPKPEADVYNIETLGTKELKFSFKLTPDNTAIYVLEKSVTK